MLRSGSLRYLLTSLFFSFSSSVFASGNLEYSIFQAPTLNQLKETPAYIQHCFNQQRSACLIEIAEKDSTAFVTNEFNLANLLEIQEISNSSINFQILDELGYERLRKSISVTVEWEFSGEMKYETYQRVQDCDNAGKCVLGVVGGSLGGGLTGAAAGSVLPAVGSVLGGFIGAVAGAASGAAAACFDGDSSDPFSSWCY